MLCVMSFLNSQVLEKFQKTVQTPEDAFRLLWEALAQAGLGHVVQEVLEPASSGGSPQPEVKL